MSKILIVEDDKELCELFTRVLEKNGYSVKQAPNGAVALEEVASDYYDLIISDIMMPVMDGYRFITELRARDFKIPVIIITAKGAFEDMKQGFLSGSDDYMVKPVNPNEMLLRIDAILRRVRMMNERRLSIGGTLMEIDSLTVTMSDGDSIVLPQKEFMILYKMASSPGKIFTRQQMLDEIWNDANKSDTHTVDVHIARLRDRFRGNNDFEIITIRDVGYKLIKK